MPQHDYISVTNVLLFIIALLLLIATFKGWNAA
jgi:hypothetical protein